MLIVLGAVIMGTGNRFAEKEYALSIGMVLLMFGIYKSTQVWTDKKEKGGEEPKEEEGL